MFGVMEMMTLIASTTISGKNYSTMPHSDPLRVHFLGNSVKYHFRGNGGEMIFAADLLSLLAVVKFVGSDTAIIGTNHYGYDDLFFLWLTLASVYYDCDDIVWHLITKSPPIG